MPGSRRKSPRCSFKSTTASFGSAFSLPENARRGFKQLAFPRRDLVGITLSCCASSANVFSPLIAANATFALNAGEWVLRLRFVIKCF